MKERLIKLHFTIEKLSLREKMIFLFGALAAMLLLWFLISYLPQTKSIANTKAQIQTTQEQTTVFREKHTNILRLMTDNTTIKLLAKFAQLKKGMQQLEQSTIKYDKRYIGQQALAKLLYALLQQTSGVSIINFSDIPSAATATPQQPQSSNTSSSTTSSTTPASTATTNTPTDAVLATRLAYSLTLKGDYFSILNYLYRLEHLEWQLYWDKLDYKVENYPQAIAVVEFYTLRPTEEDLATSPEVGQ